MGADMGKTQVITEIIVLKYPQEMNPNYRRGASGSSRDPNPWKELAKMTLEELTTILEEERRKNIDALKAKTDAKKLQELVSKIQAGSDNRDNNKQQSIISNEKECQIWLEGLMENNSATTKIKKEYQIDAKKNYSVGIKAFNRAWANAISTTSNTNWGKPGRKKSIPPY